MPLGEQTPELNNVAFASKLKALAEAPVALCQAVSGRDDSIGSLGQGENFLSDSPWP